MTTTTLQIGDEIPSTSKKVFQRALVERDFSANSIHRDEYTKQMGYPGALVSAYVLAGYMSEPLVSFFGVSWFTTGRYSLRFIGRGVQLHDSVTCHGQVTTLTEEPDGLRVGLGLWIEKSGGERPVLGQASGILRRMEGPTVETVGVGERTAR